MRYLILLLLGCLAASAALWGQPAFVETTAAAGLSGAGSFRGVAVGDYNGDGYDDLYFARLNGPNQLYRNNTDGTFTETAAPAGLLYPGASAAAVWGDLDNDGDLDLVLGNRDEPSRLYRNNGNGAFTDITITAGLILTAKVQSLNLADVNNDGLLDIYFANLNAENALFVNLGNNRFSNQTTAYGLTDPSISMGAVFFDYNLDGHIDLYLTHDGDVPNILYRNNGNGTFTDVSVAANANFAGQGMGVDVGDLNNDGWPDLYITNLYENALLINNGNGTFTDLSALCGIQDLGMGWGTCWLDYNLDGWQDIYVNNDTYFTVLGVSYPNVLYRNTGNLGFVVAESNTTLASPYGGYGAAALDYNRDGRPDLVVANSGADGNQLFANQEESAHRWIGIQLTGVTSNRSAVGARVALRVGARTLHDQVTAGASFCSQNSLNLHFGLANADTVDQLVIYWPSGIVDTHSLLPANQYHHLTEGQTLVATAQVQPAVSTPWALQVSPNPTCGELRFQVDLPTATTALDAQLFDLQGRLAASKAWGPQPAGSFDAQWSLPPGALPNGTYLLRLLTPAGSVQRRVLWQCAGR